MTDWQHGKNKSVSGYDGIAGPYSDKLMFWVQDTLPDWRDNEPYYALAFKAQEIIEEAVAAALKEAKA